MLEILSDAVNLLRSLGIDVSSFEWLLRNPIFQTTSIVLGIGVLLAQYAKIALHEIVIFTCRAGYLNVARLFGIKTIYILTDADDIGSVTANVATKLEAIVKKKVSRLIRVKPLQNGDELMSLPLHRWLTEAVVIFNTDVSTLSNDIKRRKILQARLKRYCLSGGVLIVSHDTLYRRAKNELLQDLAGCQITEFFAVQEPVRYQRVENGTRHTENDHLATRLPRRLLMDDKEVVTGEWMPGVEFLYVWADYPDIPLATRRSVGKGQVFWCNTGDRAGGSPPPSLASPKSPICHMLADLIMSSRY